MEGAGVAHNVVTTVKFEGEHTVVRVQYSHPQSAFCMTAPYRMFHFDEALQRYCFPAIESGVEFFSAYNVQVQPIPGIILWLFDTGASVHLSPDPRHFFVKHASNITIHGVGERKVTAWAPAVISVLSNSLRYIQIHTGRVYQMKSLGFPILAWPHLAILGFKAVLEQDFPQIRAPLGQGVIPLIHDPVTGMLWLAERVHASPSIQRWQQLKRHHSQDPEVTTSPDMPTLDMIETVPDKPDNKDNIDHYIQLQQAALAISLAFRHQSPQRTPRCKTHQLRSRPMLTHPTRQVGRQDRDLPWSHGIRTLPTTIMPLRICDLNC